MRSTACTWTKFLYRRLIQNDSKAYGYKEEEYTEEELEQMEAELAELEEYTDDELGEMEAELLNLNLNS